MNTKANNFALTVVMLLALMVQPVLAAQSVGINRMTVPANTDVRITLPFNQQTEGEYTVNTVTGSGVTVSASLPVGAYAGIYLVRFTSGASEGLWSTIVSNDVHDIDLVDMDVKNEIAAGDTFRIIKHHTLRSVFPANMDGVSYNSNCQVLIWVNDLSAMGQNRSHLKTAYYLGGNWVGSGISNNTILTPETMFVLRNASISPLQLSTLGVVPDYTVSMLIAADGDLVIGSGYPVPVTLNNAGIGGTGRIALLYDNSRPGYNNSNLKTAYYYPGPGWVGAGIVEDEPINPSESITFRLPTIETGTRIFINKPY
ncbi:MAG: TIGR02597 family protein [Candidatus Omnitrophica bacterium]|nr:TIGR02597 family protein [Candidatus Omnitrophota bacterium]